VERKRGRTLYIKFFLPVEMDTIYLRQGASLTAADTTYVFIAPVHGTPMLRDIVNRRDLEHFSFTLYFGRLGLLAFLVPFLLFFLAFLTRAVHAFI